MMNFVCENNLGKLARLLRLTGFDAAYSPAYGFADVIAETQNGRTLLTRDRHIRKKLSALEIDIPLFIIRADEPYLQLSELFSDAGINPDPTLFFTRCSVCNTPLEHAAPKDVVSSVPQHVAVTHRHFLHCPGCGHIYWHGSHVDSLLSLLTKLSPASARFINP